MAKAYFHLNIFLQNWKLKRVSKQRWKVNSLISLSPGVKRQKQTQKHLCLSTAPFMSLQHISSISCWIHQYLVSHCFLSASKRMPSLGAGTDASKHTKNRISDSNIKKMSIDFLQITWLHIWEVSLRLYVRWSIFSPDHPYWFYL